MEPVEASLKDSLHNHEGLSFVAVPVCVPCCDAPSGDDGIRTRANRSTICRAQPLTLRHPVAPAVAQVGFEPTASLVLSQGGLPIAYRASCVIRPQRRTRA